MVSRLITGKATALASRLSAFIEERAKATGKALSTREIERLTGVPHQRVSDFLRAPERRTAATIARIEAALSSPGLQFSRQGQRTTRVDAPLWTPESLRSLSRPDGARGFQFVYRSDAYGTGYAQTILTDMRSEYPEDAIGLIPGFDLDSVVSVVWYRG